MASSLLGLSQSPSREATGSSASSPPTFLTILPPIGFLLTSLASKNRFCPVMINENEPVLSAVNSNDRGSQHADRHTAHPTGTDVATEAEG